jgi:hypothetical protein
MQNIDIREGIKLLLFFGGAIILFACIITLSPRKGDVVTYDCSISEISPDIPIEVKEICRKLRAEK